MSDHIPYTELWRDGECSFILSGDDFRRLVADTQRLARFRTLWASYTEALSANVFTMDLKDREANEQQVWEAYQQLDRLSKEGV